ncbi:phosphocholine cytidylyltransferase family protein [Candidatus Bathyarchaeota archaeon]|nr:phosphocholine cytidylyltransferase family protein [Candidatus Bathyarchaeota archaeon]
MKGLIIAAGRGERFRPFTDEYPKPLIPLLGRPLIERVILAVREAGIKDLIIVTGYLGEKLRVFLDDGSKYGVSIKYVENERWRLGNGVSVYEARGLIDGNFILLMSDHVFNPEIICELQRYRIGKDECVLCVDTRMRYVFDVDDATKVLVDGDRILQIGKELKNYNGVDMGIFLCSSSIFEALDRSIRMGRYSLTEAIRELANEGKMRACCFDDEEHYWMDIDTPRMERIAEKILPILEELEVPAEELLRDGSMIRLREE